MATQFDIGEVYFVDRLPSVGDDGDIIVKEAQDSYDIIFSEGATSASVIGISDAGDYFTSTNVEDALQELAALSQSQDTGTDGILDGGRRTVGQGCFSGGRRVM